MTIYEKSTSRRSAMLRLLSYMFVLAAVSGARLVHQVRAELGQRALSLGREFEATVAKHVPAGTTEFRVNGQEAALNSRVVDESIAGLLDRFEALCAKNSGGMIADFEDAKRRGAKLGSARGFGLLRSERGQEAAAACFVRKRDGGYRTLLTDLGRALETGDLGEVGQINYIFARRTRDGRSTHVLTVWNRGALDVGAMFPEHGDAAGSDLAPGARPADSTRLLSGETNHHELGAFVYETVSAPGVALQSYCSAMERAGYRVVGDSAAYDGLPVDARIYSKDDRAVYLMAYEHEGKTLVVGLKPNDAGHVRVEL